MGLQVSQKATCTLEITQAHVPVLRRNHRHFDATFAAGTKFGHLVVRGGLTTGLLHALVAMDMPSPGPVFLSQDWKFAAPVFIGDTITTPAEVANVHASK